MSQDKLQQSHSENGAAGDESDVDRLELVLTVLCTVFLGTGFFGSLLGWIPELYEKLLYVGAYLTGGYYGVLESYRYLKKLRFNVDVLMILAAAGAAVIGEWVEGATLLFLFSLSNTLQTFAMGRSRRAIRALMQLRPNEAWVRRNGEEERIPVEDLRLDDIVIVRPGERIPIDGEIVKGQTAIDQSAITGESMPVDKKAGDDVFAATMNEHGAIEVKVTHTAEDTTLAKIIQLVEQAQTRKATTQRFLDKFESRYATGVIFFTIGLILVPWLMMGKPFDPVFYQAMTILVVASPCALIISTPATILSAIANAARNGILFKGGAYLEEAARIEAVAFDKTGTLTLGTPEVTDVLAVADVTVSAGDMNGNNNDGSITEAGRHLLRIAASAEQYSEHHLGRAIVSQADKEALEIADAENLQAVAGQGIKAEVEHEVVYVGNLKFYEDHSVEWPEPVLERAHKLEELEGKTVVFVASENKPLGIIALADTLRPQAVDALEKLRDLGLNELIMITGDADRVARNVADTLKINEYYAGLMPEQKVEYVEQIAQKRSVAMVGDGVNDAPALAASHLGVAMGAAGTDVALETADVVLMADDLNKLPYVIELSRRARRVVWQNIGFALAVIAVLVASVFAFNLPLPLGVVGHEGSTLIVVLNGLRLLKS